MIYIQHNLALCTQFTENESDNVFEGLYTYRTETNTRNTIPRLTAYRFNAFNPDAIATVDLDEEYLEGKWSPDGSAEPASGFAYQFSGKKLVVYDYTDGFLYATFNSSYFFLEDGRIHHKYKWEQYDWQKNVVDSYNGKLNYSLRILTPDVVLIDGEILYRLNARPN